MATSQAAGSNPVVVPVCTAFGNPAIPVQGSKKLEIEQGASEEKIGMPNASFPQFNVGNRDLKKKREEHDDFKDSEGSTPPFSLFEVRP